MPDRSPARPPGTLRVIAVAAAVLAVGLTGCATEASRREADLTALKLALPGSYRTTRTAAGGGAGSAEPAHAPLAVTLSIVPVQSANVIGETVYFVRETAADNDQLVLAQNIWTFAIDARYGVVQKSFLLKDPERWIGAAQHPSVLVSLLPDDLVPMSGCALAWTRTPTGFMASALAGTCRPGRAAAGLWIERHARLSDAQLSLTERRSGADGALDTRGTPMTITLTRILEAPKRP